VPRAAAYQERARACGDLIGMWAPTLRSQMTEDRMGIERREKGRRAEVVRAVVDHVVHKAETTVTLEGLQDFLHIPQDAAGRIVSSLVNAGIVREVRAGLWQRVPDLPAT
jgi:hypothetical protein